MEQNIGNIHLERWKSAEMEFLRREFRVRGLGHIRNEVIKDRANSEEDIADKI